MKFGTDIIRRSSLKVNKTVVETPRNARSRGHITQDEFRKLMDVDGVGENEPHPFKIVVEIPDKVV